MSAKEVRRAGVMERVGGGELRLVAAAELLGLSYRQTKRIHQRYRQEGARGLVHRSAGRPSNRSKPRKFREKVLRLVRQKYGGGPGERFGPTLATEHLEGEDGLKVDAETLRRWMLEEGLWSRERNRRAYRRRRERRRHFGELLQLDGSFHDWLEARGPQACLMDLVDDATGTMMCLLAEEETIWAAVDLLWAWVKKYGVPQALYTDGKNVYVREATEEEKLGGQAPLTAFGRMCQKLGIRIIAAHSPQAKGRVERKHGVHQDRLIKKMRLQRIGTLEEGNDYLRRQYWAEHNRRFARPPAGPADFHTAVPQGLDLRKVFCLEEERTVSNDWVVRYNSRLLQIQKQSEFYPPAQGKVTVSEWRDGSLHVLYRGQPVAWRELAQPPLWEPKQKLPTPPRKRYVPGRDHPWRKPLWDRPNTAQAEA